MPTDSRSVWLMLAHQDDEFALQCWIKDALAEGLTLRCCYFTKAHNLELDAQRNRESLKVLQRLGVPASNVFFPGRELNVPDGELQKHLGAIALWIRQNFEVEEPVRVAVPAWEGGHPDHDALHAVVIEVCAEMGILDRIRQFPLYNAFDCRAPWFKVLSPLPQNGPVEVRTMSWMDRWRYLRNCLSYPSQTISWLGLFPFVAWHVLYSGREQCQHVSLARLTERPHEGPLYYESRNFSSWQAMQADLAQWRLTR